MSEVQKPVVVEEQQPSVTETATPAPAVAESTPAPAVGEAPAPVTATESTPAPPAVQEDAKPVVEEAKPVVEEAKPEVAKEEFNGEGVLGYKAPGGFLKKLAGFQKRHFWFGTDAVQAKTLSNYLRGEKPEVGNHNAAWAAQTGKGLLFFSKLASDKNPIGVINLADVTDIKEEGAAEFLFHIHGQKHVFQATSISLRDSWVETLKGVSAGAKEAVETIKASENYKNAHASLTKPLEVAPFTPKEERKDEVAAAPAVVETNPTTTEVAAVTEEPKLETKDEKKSRTKSRSASRKRQSIFGSFNLGGKKSEEVVPKVENKDEVKAESPVEQQPIVAASEPAQVEPAVAVAPSTEDPVVAKSTEEVRPAAAKRHSSLFDFKSRFGQKKAATPAPAVPAKDQEETVTSAEAPVIPAVEQSESLATSLSSPATVPTETTTVGEPHAAAATTETKVEATPESKAEKRKSSLPFGFGSKKEKTVDGEKPLSPFAKLRQTVKGKKPEEKPVEEAAPLSAEKKSDEKPVEAAAPVAATQEPKSEELKEATAPAPAAPVANPTIAATA